MDHDDMDSDRAVEHQKLAMQAAHEGRLVQLAQHEAFMRGEKVDFKNHQGISHVEVLDPKALAQPKKSQRLKFQDRYRFFDAVTDGEADIVEELLQNGMDVNLQNEDGLTVLHQCCIDNNLKMASLLFQQPGLDVNVQDCDWWTPLHAAAACGHWRLVNNLLSHGADATLVNSDAELAIDIADGDRTKGILNDQMAQLGITEEKLEALRVSPEHNMLQHIQELIDSKGDLDAKDHFGNALLHIATANGWLDCMTLLLKNKADIDVRDIDGNTPLHVGVFFGEYHAVELLGKFNATLEIHNRCNQLAEVLTDDPMMMRLMKALKSKQLDANLLAAAPRNRTHTAAKRRSTANKKDMQKMDLAAEFQKFSHPEPAGPIGASAAASGAGGAGAGGAGSGAATNAPAKQPGDDLYSVPHTNIKKTVNEINAASAPTVSFTPNTTETSTATAEAAAAEAAKVEATGRDNVVPSHPKLATKQRKDSKAAIMIDQEETKKGGCCVIS